MSRAPDIATILICEDSPTFASGLKEFLETDHDLRVVAICATAEEAVARVHALKPDLVTMDLVLPGEDGIRAISRIMTTRPTPVLALSAHVQRGSVRAAAALGAGALDVSAKRQIRLDDRCSAQSVAFRRRVKRLARTPVAAHGGGRRRSRSRRARGRSAAAIGICASTGGPPALKAVLGALPADFPVPLLVVQHIAAGFLRGLVDWLQGEVALPVGVAHNGSALGPGAWFAPDGAHLVMDGHLRTHLDRHTVAGYHRPAADVLFASMAAAAGPRAVGVVLTGMGSDGAHGTAAIRAAGGLTIAQDAEEATVPSMPRAAHEQGAEMVLPLTDIGAALASLEPAGRTA